MTSKYILIADDDTKLCAALSARLEANGFEVATAHDAYQALAAAQRDTPDLLLLDINMPAGTGMSVQQRLKSTPELRNLPIIFMTGESAQRVEDLAVEYGTNLASATVLRKPFEHGVLLAAIDELAEPQLPSKHADRADIPRPPTTYVL